MMDSNFPSPPPDNTDAKNAFRKPSGDAANRNYRRRSPVDGSPSSAGSPKRERSSSPIRLTGDSVRVSENHSRKDDIKEQDRHYSRNHSGRSGDSFRHSDRQSSRSSHGLSRHDDYVRHDKYGDEDRYRERLSSRSGHESRGDHIREENDSRSKDYPRTMDKYSRDKYDRSDCRSKEKDRETSSLEYQKYKDKDSSYDRTGSGRRHAPSDEVERERHTRDRDGRDERRDSRRTSGDYRSDRAGSYTESRSQREDSGSRRDTGKYRLKEGYKSEPKELDGQKLPWEEKKKYDDYDMGQDKDRSTRKAGEQFGDEDKESSAKKPKLFGVDKDDNYGKDDERQISSSKLVQESKVDLGTAEASGSEGGSDLNAAKVAAMKAAELVNKNLVGVGCLTTDQKKKLLWGNKKNATAEESGHRWDTALFSDRERQEKFNKLMSLRLHWCLWPLVGCERRCQGGTNIREPKWQRSSVCREAAGTPAGSRETVQSRSSTKRWPNSWIGSLNVHLDFEYHAPIIRRVMLLVSLCHVWECMYALMSDTSSLGSWWEFLVSQKHVDVMMTLVKIVSQFLLYDLYETGLTTLIHALRNLICFLSLLVLLRKQKKKKKKKRR